jgi:hypothetical protein
MFGFLVGTPRLYELQILGLYLAMSNLATLMRSDPKQMIDLFSSPPLRTQALDGFSDLTSNVFDL